MSDSLDAQYRLLNDLKEIDERAWRIERDAEKIPDEIQKHEESLASKRQALDQAKSQFQDCEKKMRSAERELKDKEDALFKAEGKMMEVKTNQEYQAAIKENDTQKQAKGALEERLLQLINEMEGQKGALESVVKEFGGYEQGVLQEKKKLSDEHQVLMKQLEQFLRQRKTLSDQLQPDVASLYLKITTTIKGVAVTLTENGRCTSCNMQVRPQIYNEVLGKKAIHRCSSCGRILVVSNRTVESLTGTELGTNRP